MNTNTCSFSSEISLDFLPAVHTAYSRAKYQHNNVVRKQKSNHGIFTGFLVHSVSHVKNNTQLMKRQTELSTRIHHALFILAIIAVITIGRFMITSASERIHDPQLNKYYTSITVQENDSLWNIASQYNTGSEDNSSYIRSIKKLNNMTSDTLYNGENLLIYYFSPEEK